MWWLQLPERIMWACVCWEDWSYILPSEIHSARCLTFLPPVPSTIVSWWLQLQKFSSSKFPLFPSIYHFYIKHWWPLHFQSLNTLRIRKLFMKYGTFFLTPSNNSCCSHGQVFRSYTHCATTWHTLTWETPLPKTSLTTISRILLRSTCLSR